MSGSDDGERSQIGTGVTILMIVLLSCLIVGVITYSQGRESERRNQSPHHHAESAKASAKSACVGSDPVAVFECVYDKVEASEETARSEQDLDAQQGMKLWTLAVALISGAMALISVVALIYLRGTLIETRKAVGDTSEANNIARRAMLTQNRAWLTVDVCLSKELRIDGDDKGYARVSVGFAIRNVGNMPAKNVCIDTHLVDWISRDLVAQQIRFADEFKERARGYGFPNAIIFPNSRDPFLWGASIISEPGLMKQIREQMRPVEGATPLHLGIVGCVQYLVPGSDEVFQTGFAYRIDRPHPDGGNHVICEEYLPLDTATLRLSLPLRNSALIT